MQGFGPLYFTKVKNDFKYLCERFPRNEDLEV